MGSNIIQERMTNVDPIDAERVYDNTKEEVMELLRRTIRPEFLNRIDEIIMFTPLSRNEIKDVLRIQMKVVEDMLAKNDIHLTITNEALEYLAEIGYDESGQLTEAVRRKPYSIVLFDEIEKAHPDVFNILLQVLEDGRLTDNKGRIADFKNTIIIMTSNMGSNIIQERMTNVDPIDAERVYDNTKEEVMELLRRTIRPEFLNRIDEIIMFTPLSRNEIKDVLRIQMNTVEALLAKNDIHITITDDALEYLAEIGYDPTMGARPVKRVIQRRILNELSKEILAEKIRPNDNIVVDVFDGNFVFYNPDIKKH